MVIKVAIAGPRGKMGKEAVQQLLIMTEFLISSSIRFIKK